MKGEKFYEMLDLLDDNLVLESAEVKRRVWNWRLTLLGVILAGVVIVWLISTYPARHPTDSLGGDPGVIQDGVYYAYAGSGIPIPGQTLVPQGIFRYVPGEGKTCVVSLDDHKINSMFHQWGANTHGLYFVDYSDGALWRQDLATGEETCLLTPEALSGTDLTEGQDTQEPQEEGDIWVTIRDILTGEADLETEDVAQLPSLFLNAVLEDEVQLTCTLGEISCDIRVDSRTGALLADPVPWEGSSRPMCLQAGERIIQPVKQDYPEGFTYFRLEEDLKYDLHYWIDFQENGVSLLPEGMVGDEFISSGLSGGILLGYYPMTHQDEEGNNIDGALDFLFLTQEGETYPLPREIEGLFPNYLGAAGGWIYYVSNDHENPDVSQRGYHLRAWNLETGETCLIQEKFGYQELVTDGHWLYKCLGGRTDCYTIDYDAQGKPCGLTLVEEDI